MPRPSRAAACLAHLARSGGAAHRDALVEASSAAALRACVREGLVVWLGQGWYAVPRLSALLASPPAPPDWHLFPQEWPPEWRDLLRARHVVATAMRGALARRTAALQRGWAVLTAPSATEVALAHGRREPPAVPARGPVVVLRRHLSGEERGDGVCGPVRTVLDCAAVLPFPEALAVADSALRSGDVGALELRHAADGVLHGRERARRVASAASPLAANPFESALRAVVGDLADFRPQVEVHIDGAVRRVDLGDPVLQIALEADSYTFHGADPAAFRADVRRYNALVCQGWRVLRVPFGDLMARPESIRAQVEAVVAERRWEAARRR